MEKEHIEAIKTNIEIGNYNKIYCESCGNEIDVYEDEKSRQEFFDNGNICEECNDNNY